MYYKGADLLLKINNYVPPAKEELEETMMAVDTWHRGTQFPPYFNDYFHDTFMIPAYTCDQLSDPKDQYPGFKRSFSCYCNNGDYHTMPTINMEVRNKGFQYDMGPSDYMFLPYINYTQPMSLCMLSVMPTTHT